MSSPAKPWEKIEGKKSEHYVSSYANNVQMQTNFFDCALVFSEMLGTKVDESQTLLVEEKARIVLTLTQCKLLAMTMMSQIFLYEKRFGEIDLPNEIVPPEMAAFVAIWNREKENEGR